MKLIISNKLLTIVEGEGRGQYGYITSYDWNTGGVISRNSNKCPTQLELKVLTQEKQVQVVMDLLSNNSNTYS